MQQLQEWQETRSVSEASTGLECPGWTRLPNVACNDGAGLEEADIHPVAANADAGVMVPRKARSSARRARLTRRQLALRQAQQADHLARLTANLAEVACLRSQAGEVSPGR
jgi:hypothetical protein